MHLFPIANSTAPEAAHARLVRGDFSRLSLPILVAAESQKQLEEFCWKHALIAEEVRRFQGYQERFNTYPENKVLLLLPGWSHSARTAEAVCHWVNVEDRHTCQLTHPAPSFKRRKPPGFLSLFIKAAATAAVLVFILHLLLP